MIVLLDSIKTARDRPVARHAQKDNIKISKGRQAASFVASVNIQTRQQTIWKLTANPVKAGGTKISKGR